MRTKLIRLIGWAAVWAVILAVLWALTVMISRIPNLGDME